jgi:hypothetical protein
MFLELNWTANIYQPRFGSHFTDIRGWRSFASLKEARDVLAMCGLELGKKTDSRTWEIVLRR